MQGVIHLCITQGRHLVLHAQLLVFTEKECIALQAVAPVPHTDYSFVLVIPMSLRGLKHFFTIPSSLRGSHG